MAPVENNNENVQCSYCCIYTQALACKRIPAELASSLSEAAKIVNFVKYSAKNSSLLREIGKSLCLFSTSCRS